MTNLWTELRDQYRRDDGRVILRDRTRALTGTELLDYSGRFAASYMRQSYRKGDLVVVPTSNGVEDVAALLGAALINGATLVVERVDLNSRLLERAGSLFPSVIVAGELDIEVTKLPPNVRCAAIGCSDQTPEPTNASADEPFLLQPTSGSMGRRKLAIIGQYDLIKGAQIYQAIWNYDIADVVLVPISISHSFGLIGGVLAGLLAGAEVVIGNAMPPRQLLADIQRTKATILFGSPPMYELLNAAHAAGKPMESSLRLCLSSGMALGSGAKTACVNVFGLQPAQVYGSTETGIIAATWPQPELFPPDVVGRAVPGTTIKIAGKPAEGSVLVRTATMFKGYYHRSAGAAGSPDKWYSTGDLGSLSDEGYLKIRGRNSSFINVGGKKVTTTEVEEALLSHPAVIDASVRGSPDGSGSEQVYALVYARQALTSGDLLEVCRRHLATYKLPRQIEIRTEPFRTELGKARSNLALDYEL